MTDLDALIRDLERATGPDRQLSDHVLLACGMDPDVLAAHLEYEKPHPTASLDDALSLVPEGWRRIDAIFLEGRDQFFTIENQAMARGNTAPLAVCIAVLRARKGPQ